MEPEVLISIDNLSHYYGSGAMRKQILFGITAEIRRGEIIILTGPSGSGKTTLLTLAGCLRSAQEGSLKVLGQELRDASEATLVSVRKKIGYIFQSHNLLDSLTAIQNVEMALDLRPGMPKKTMRERSQTALEAVGLGDKLQLFPHQLSGGQRQRVAIARALVSEPSLILADEPTASLDKKSGREVVDLMQQLAKQRGCAVLLVTHDNRILDIADRIIHLEDGRLSSLSDAVIANTQNLFNMLAQQNRRGELVHRMRDMSVPQFAGLLEKVTAEFQQFLRAIDMSNSSAFESMLEQVLEAFNEKIGQVLAADRATLYLIDKARGELWSKVAQSDGERPLEIRMPVAAGIAGRVATTAQAMNIPDAYAEPLFNREVDRQTGYRTRSILCVPVRDSRGEVFAVAQLLNRRDGAPFDRSDEDRFEEFARSMGVLLETWWRMSQRVRPEPAAAS